MSITEVEIWTKTVDELEKQLKDAKNKLEKLKKYPLKTKFYMHSSDEDNYHHGAKLGLKGTQLENFSGTGYEIGFDIEVDEDGTSYATHVNGTALVERVQI